MTLVCLPTAESRDLVAPLPEGVEVVVWSGDGDPPAHAADIEFLLAEYGPGAWTAEALARLPKLRVIQLMSAGVESWSGQVPPGVTLCSGRGVHGASTAELAVAGILSLLRELPRFAADQAAHRWSHTSTDGLDGRQVLILGAGDIGRRVAAVVEVLGGQPTLVARHARDGVHTVDELPDLLPGQHVVVVALPLSPATERLVDASFLAAMPDGAILVNVARGAIVDTGALLAELMSTRLAAFLDVTDPEPLPADHPLWDAPNLLLTPHIGGGTHGWESRAYPLVRDQIARAHDGRPLRNVVREGY